MATFDWHAERTDLSDIALLDRAPESEGIDLKAVRLYRLGRVRAEMAARDLDGFEQGAKGVTGGAARLVGSYRA